MMDENLEVKTIMTPFPHTVGAEQNLSVAKSMMMQHNVRHLPVQTGGSLVGVISERDIYFALAIDQKDPCDLDINSCYTADPYVVPPDAKACDVARAMAHEHIGCCLVADDRKVLGIVTTVDACRVLSEVLSGKLDQ